MEQLQTQIAHRPFQAITTKVLPATNTKPTRVKATTASGLSMTRSWDHALDGYGNARAVAWDLIERMGWGGRWVSGATQKGYVFCRA